MNPEAEIPVGVDTWFVVQSRPRQELLAAAAIERRTALQVFVPEILEQHRSRKEPKPLFPGYLFVATEPQQLPLHTLNKTPGVLRVVGFDGAPQPVDHAVVAALRDRCADINASGGLPRHGFKPGDPVRLIEGPLAGLEGVFQGPMTPAARVQVLLTFLGRQQIAKVPVAHLERAANPVHAKPPRRTRGKGRHIAGSAQNHGASPRLS